MQIEVLAVIATLALTIIIALILHFRTKTSRIRYIDDRSVLPYEAPYEVSVPQNPSPCKADKAVEPSDQPSRVLFGDPENPLIEIYLSSESAIQKEISEPLPLGQGLIDNLQPLLAQAPSMIANASHALGTSVILKFAPEAAKGLREGSLTLMKSLEGGVRAIATDSSGKTVAHGSLHFVSNTNPATIALAVWQVLAIVTAQKYLADISKRLAKIETAVEDIREWLENDRWAKIVSSIKYVSQLGERLSSQKITELETQTLLGALEDIERQASHTCEAVRGQLQMLHRRYENLNLHGIKLRKNTKEAESLINEYQHQTKTFLAAAFLRGHTVQLRAAMPTSRSLALDRVNCVLDDVKECSENMATFERLVERRLPELKGRFSTSKTEKDCRSHVSNHLKKTILSSQSMCAELSDSAQLVADQLQLEMIIEKSPVLLAVSVDNTGTINKVHRLRDANLKS